MKKELHLILLFLITALSFSGCTNSSTNVVNNNEIGKIKKAVAKIIIERKNDTYEVDNEIIQYIKRGSPNEN